MSTRLEGLDRVIEQMRQPIAQYAEQIQALAGDNALALTLFGAIAAGSFDANRHTVRNVLILDSVDLEMLRRLAKDGVRLGKARISAPLIMTPPYINASLDTFPLELIEIHQCHITLFGHDHFDSLSFKDSDVRLQCERELKTILIGMRQGLLAAAGREKLMGALEADVGERLVRTLRGLLWLKGQRDAKPAGQVISEVENIIQGQLPGVRNVLRASGPQAWEQFRSLYEDVETVGKIVDAW
ncbi:MAG: hypothetical protein ACE5IQ_02800 [Candidatus Methylomirabilales bacterium]